MKPGDCVNIPVGVKHWHGAAPDSWFIILPLKFPEKMVQTNGLRL